jgi:tetratricopeptide (TPR) repeat protein
MISGILKVCSLAAILLIFNITVLKGQSDLKYIRQGNGKYQDGKYPESETFYRKALDKNRISDHASFNLGDALYKQKKYDDAGKSFLETTEKAYDNIRKSNSLYNLGNSLLNNNKTEESINAYKNSLRLNPGNQQAKYNLAYAQDLLRQQKQQQQQQQQQDNNQDKNDREKDNKDQQKDNQQKQQDQQKDQQKQQQQQQGVSREDAQRLLDALANDEKKVQEKVKQAKAARERIRSVINW